MDDLVNNRSHKFVFLQKLIYKEKFVMYTQRKL